MLELTPVFGVFFALFILATAWVGVAALLVLYPLIVVAPTLWRAWRDWLVGMWLKMPTVCVPSRLRPRVRHSRKLRYPPPERQEALSGYCGCRLSVPFYTPANR